MSKKRPNIVLFFSDQQRADTVGLYGQKLNITPNLDKLGNEGITYYNAFTPQPVCGPFRATLQSGKYPTETGCYTNQIALPLNIKTLANYFEEAGYDTGYVGKWHLASDGEMEKWPLRIDYQHSAIPIESRGGYKGFWRVSDILEFTSHGYGGYVFDENMNKHTFDNYRCDAITDFGLEYLDQIPSDKPFFLTISHIESHHQNDHNHYEGPNGSKEKFKNCEIPKDLSSIPGGDYIEEYPDYLGQVESLDNNLGRVIQKLKELGIYDNTVVVYVSDHGSHFRTRNRDENLCGYDDYKRTGHDAALKVPLVIGGGAIKESIRVNDIVSTAGLPKTLLAIAGVDVGEKMINENLVDVAYGRLPNRKNHAFAQISESRVGRVLRTDRFLLGVVAKGVYGGAVKDSLKYEVDYFYDMANDPYQLNDIKWNDAYRNIIRALCDELENVIFEEEHIESKIDF